MKKYIKIFTCVLAAVIALSCCVFSTNAAIPPQMYGDLDYDYNVTIADATIIQRHLAQIEPIIGDSQESADVDHDNQVTIFDVILIQQYLAGYDVDFPYDETYLIDAYLYSVIPTYDSGKAMAGIPVEFMVDGYNEPGPDNVKLYVDHELVAQVDGSEAEGSRYNFIVSHTFEKAGTYDITVVICDKWGKGIDWLIEDYKVVEPVVDISKPVITSIRRDSLISRTPEITAIAQFGTAPYEYKFELYETWWLDGEGETDLAYLTQDFSDDNTFDVELEPYRLYKLKVTVRDANGNETTEKQSFEMHIVDPA